jgi:Spy/CpxP family protein refolding chaperone
MKISRWSVITLAAGLGVGGLFAFKAHAAERVAAQRVMHGRLLERAKEKLGLTDEQVAKIKTELKGEKDTLRDLISRLHDARVGVREAIQAADANESSVRAASAKVAAVEADLAVERLKIYGKISPILTAEQVEKVREFQARLDDFLDNAINHVGDRLVPDK